MDCGNSKLHLNLSQDKIDVIQVLHDCLLGNSLASMAFFLCVEIMNVIWEPYPLDLTLVNGGTCITTLKDHTRIVQ